MNGIITIDCGNTLVKAAYFAGGRLVASTRFDYDDVAVLMRFVSSHKPLWAIVSTVVNSTACDNVIASLMRRCHRCVIMDHDTHVPTSVHYKQHQIGIDRVAAAVGAHTLHSGARLLVADAGTALTLDVVDHDGTLMGGFIAPGVSMGLESLHEHTSRLPVVDAAGPTLEDGLPHDTVQAMRWGAILGAASHIDACAASHGCDLVVLTGGDAAVLAPHLRHNAVTEPDLVLHGLNSILQYNIDNQYV